MHICTVIKENAQSLQNERNKYVFKRDFNDDNEAISWLHSHIIATSIKLFEDLIIHFKEK